MATGSYPWIPPIKGSDTQDCFVYRTIEDLNAIESCARRSKRGAVVGGGLLGLEAAGALKNLGIETHVIEFAPMLMAEQLDQMGGEQLRRKIESMGVRVHTSKNTLEIVQEGVEARKTMRFADGSELEVDFIVFSTGIAHGAFTNKATITENGDEIANLHQLFQTMGDINDGDTTPNTKNII